MIAIWFGPWSQAGGIFLKWERLYWRGFYGDVPILGTIYINGWTPFCRIRKRYGTWLGFWDSEQSIDLEQPTHE